MRRSSSRRTSADGHAEADETTTLLSAVASYGSLTELDSDSEPSKTSITPLPKGQIALLAYMRMATPLVDSQSLPVSPSHTVRWPCI